MVKCPLKLCIFRKYMDFFAPLLSLPSDLENKRSKVRDTLILQSGLRYFDWTASGLAATCVESRIQSLLPFYANTHSRSNANAELMSEIYENARERLKGIFGLDSNFALIACGFGATSAIKKFQELLGIYIPPKTKSLLNLQNIDKSTLPLVLISPFEHHSNELSFREGLCEVIRIALNTEGLLDLEMLKAVLAQNQGRKIIASFTLGSNVSGIVMPFREISHLVRAFGGIICYDCASTSPYVEISPEFYDALFLSPHKLLGGIGSSGILIINRALVDKTLPPTFCGGGTVGYVSRISAQYLGIDERREEAGTPGILEFLRAYLGYALRQEIGVQWINFAKIPHINAFREFLENTSNITYYGNLAHNTLGIFSFNIRGISPFEAAERLSKKYGILARAGCSCAGPYGHDLLGLEDNAIFTQMPGWVRINTHYTHTKEDIDYLINALKALCKI